MKRSPWCVGPPCNEWEACDPCHRRGAISALVLACAPAALILLLVLVAVHA